MPCIKSCLISFIFVFGMIYFYNATSSSKIVKQYKSSLTGDLLERYNKISRERLAISYYGYALGLVLSLLIIYLVKMNTQSKVCITIVITFLTNYFYYILSPKSDWMLDHLHSPEEIKSWLKMYREMQYNYHLGIVLGIIGAGILGYAFRC